MASVFVVFILVNKNRSLAILITYNTLTTQTNERQMNFRKKYTKIVFCLLALAVTNQLTAMGGKAEKKRHQKKEQAKPSLFSEPFLDENEQQEFEGFLESLNGIKRLRKTHEVMIQMQHYIKSALYAQEKKEDSLILKTYNPFSPREKLILQITHQDTTDNNREAIELLFNPFINIGSLLDQKVCANVFLPQAVKELVENSSEQLPKLPPRLRETLLQFLRMNTAILNNIPPHILCTPKGTKKLANTQFARHFARFCSAQSILLDNGLFIQSIIQPCPTGCHQLKKNTLQTYRALSRKRDDYSDFDLDTVEKEIIDFEMGKCNPEALEGFLNPRKKYSLSDTQASLRSLHNHLQTQARIYRIRDVIEDDAQDSSSEG